jgi:hypothetical protein
MARDSGTHGSTFYKTAADLLLEYAAFNPHATFTYVDPETQIALPSLFTQGSSRAPASIVVSLLSGGRDAPRRTVKLLEPVFTAEVMASQPRLSLHVRSPWEA